MKRQVFLVKAARAGQKSQPWQVKIWIPAALAKALNIQSGDVLKLTKAGRKITLRKAKIKLKEST